jgi:hypothetical protein
LRAAQGDAAGRAGLLHGQVLQMKWGRTARGVGPRCLRRGKASRSYTFICSTPRDSKKFHSLLLWCDEK